MSVSFTNSSQVPVPAVTEAEMREVDRVAIEETGPNLYQMMENAGRNLALSAMEMTEDQPRGPIVVLVGTGGNGGGGITAARHLANRGYEVSVSVTDESRLKGVPADQLKIYAGTNGETVSPSSINQLSPALVVDALIGYSLQGTPSGAVADLIGWANAQAAPILSLDLPSGLDATSGETPGAHVVPSTTLTLALPKAGLVNPVAGNLVLADIGIPAETYRRVGIAVSDDIFGRDYRIDLTRPDDITKTIESMLADVAGRHHEAFATTHGVDPDWATWYAEHLTTDLNTLLGSYLSVEALAADFVALSIAHDGSESDAPWTRFYARSLFESYKNRT